MPSFFHVEIVEGVLWRDVCFINPPLVLQACSWERYAPAWLRSRAGARRAQRDTGAGLTKWTSRLWLLSLAHRFAG